MASSPDLLQSPLISGLSFRQPNPPGRAVVAQEKIPLLHFIVALLLAKSKPPLLSLEEFIASIRSCIVRGIRLEDADASDNHVDTASFWRQSYQKMEQEQVVLLARIAELESKSEDFLISQRESSAGRATQGKRKWPSEQVTTLAAQKRAKKGHPMEQRDHEDAIEAGAVQVVEDRSASKDKRNSDACLVYTYVLRQSTLNPQAAAESIGSDLHLLTYSMQQLLCSVRKPKEDPSTALQYILATSIAEDPAEVRREGLVVKIMSFASIFPHVLQALDRLGRDPADKLQQQLAVYNIVKLFRELIGAICDIAREQREGIQTNRAGNQNVPKINMGRRTIILQENVEQDGSKAARLSQLFMIMLARLRIADGTHMEVWEGALFHLFGKVGQVLAWSMGEEQASSKNTMEPVDEADDPGIRDGIIEAQAPYLIWLLGRALKLSGVDRAALDLRSNDSGRTLSRILRPSLLKLQNTLLKAVFSKDNVEDFEPAFRLPTLSREIVSLMRLRPRPSSLSAKAAFTEDVWKLLGWDVLRDLTAWPA